MPLEALSPPFSHFDPFGTEFREPGLLSHPNLQRSFQLSPEFLATPRQSRFDCAHVDIERGRNLFVRKTFNVSQDHRFSIDAFQSAQSFSQSSFAFVSERILFGVLCGGRFKCRNKTKAPVAYFRFIYRDGCVATAAAPPAPAISCLIDRDAVNPGA